MYIQEENKRGQRNGEVGGGGGGGSGGEDLVWVAGRGAGVRGGGRGGFRRRMWR